MERSGNNLTRTALLLALTLLFQSLRFIIPVPSFFSTLIVGSLVNACLLIALETTGFYAAMTIAVVAPVVACFQQLLPLPLLIIPVALANIIYTGLFKSGTVWGKWQGIALAALGKTIFLYCSFTWLLTFIHINPKMAVLLLGVMSWPQLFTGIVGGIIAVAVVKRLRF
jgi:hypothetical protein